MLTVPASNVSVPLTVVIRTAVSVAPKVTALAPILAFCEVSKNVPAPAHILLPILVNVMMPLYILAAAPDAEIGRPVVTVRFVVLANQAPPTYPDVV